MSDRFSRARAALRKILGADRPAIVEGPGVVVSIDDNLALVDGRIAFAKPDRAAADPSAWLTLLATALDRSEPIADTALDLLRAQMRQLPTEAMLWGTVERSRFISLLHPRPGMSLRLSEMRAG